MARSVYPECFNLLKTNVRGTLGALYVALNVADETQLSIPPEQGYGRHDAKAVHIVPKSVFDNLQHIPIGMPVQGQGQQGQ
jgi:FKBP-type peptidyl-prolyl cis-trans isomerase 2